MLKRAEYKTHTDRVLFDWFLFNFCAPYIAKGITRRNPKNSAIYLNLKLNDKTLLKNTIASIYLLSESWENYILRVAPPPPLLSSTLIEFYADVIKLIYLDQALYQKILHNSNIRIYLNVFTRIGNPRVSCDFIFPIYLNIFTLNIDVYFIWHIHRATYIYMGCGEGGRGQESRCARDVLVGFTFSSSHIFFSILLVNQVESRRQICVGNAPVIILFSCCRNSFGLVVHTIYFFFRNAYEWFI